MKKRGHKELGLRSLSLVSPVYRSEALIFPLVEQIRSVLSGKDYEIVLVDDGSPDASWERIQEAAARFPEVRGIRLSRNFGQHYAISAGLQESRGKKTVVLDCDLQDRPAEIPRLLAKALEGYDIVLAQRGRRRDGIGKRLGSFLFYRLLSCLTGTPQDPSIANFGVYDRRVVEAINSLSETIRYFPTMVRWVGFRSTTVPVEHQARPHGRSSYRLFQRFQLALDICLAYSDKPLRWVVMAGFAISLLGFIFAVYTLSLAIAGKIQVLGYASLMVSLWFLTGLNILIVGVVGLYVGKSFDGIKRRPPYIIASRVNFDVPDPTA
ncbi:glycosyltransferase [bacterium]|nr:glycosyltransferase [bacterium]